MLCLRGLCVTKAMRELNNSQSTCSTKVNMRVMLRLLTTATKCGLCYNRSFSTFHLLQDNGKNLYTAMKKEFKLLAIFYHVYAFNKNCVRCFVGTCVKLKCVEIHKNYNFLKIKKNK